MALLVGLTGGMGTGKTTVAKYLNELGAFIIDADQLCRQLIEPNQLAWKEIVQEFGKEVLDKNKLVNRSKLAEIIFRDHLKKESLENILHPKVFEAEKQRFLEIQQKHPQSIVILDSPLLIESGNYRKVDKVVVVVCPEESQIKRILDSNRFTKEDAERRIRNQMNSQDKIKFADFVIHNDTNKPELKLKVKKLYDKLRDFLK